MTEQTQNLEGGKEDGHTRDLFFSSVAPCYVVGDCTLYHGDCLEILPTLGHIDAVVSDPPYGMNWNTDHTRFTAGHGPASTKKYDAVHGDNLEFDPTPWLEFEKVVLFGGNHFAQRLPVGTTLVWIKRFDNAFGSFLSDAEIAWMKGGKGVYCKRNTTLYGDTKNRLHPTQRPTGIMSWCMERAKIPQGATVLDPYMGSGTTGITCIRTGRKFIGIEKDEKHFKNALERIRKESAQGRLF